MTTQTISRGQRPGKMLLNIPAVAGDVGSVSLGRGGALYANFYTDDINPKLRLCRWRPDKAMQLRPTRSALTVQARDLPQLYDLIGRALAKARREGLVVTAADRALLGDAS
jgi:hypothetical protein